MRRVVIGAAFVFMSAAVMGCPLCLGGAVRSPAQDLADLSHAVLATPAADGKSYRVIALIKGARPEGDRVTEVALREPANNGKTLLLVRDEAWPMWASLGTVAAIDAETLRVVAAKRPADGDLDAWRARVGRLVPYLESSDPLLAEMAYHECAAAPHAALSSAKPHLNAAAIGRWVADPRLAQRRPLYVALLGIAAER